MLYLSKIIFNTENNRARQDLGNRYEMHSTISRAFDDTIESHPLWRLEKSNSENKYFLLVQSKNPPKWEELIQSYPGYLIDYKCIEFNLDRVEKDQIFRFRLEANPVVTRNGKRHALKTSQDQLNWLQRHAEKGGFVLDQVMISHFEKLSIKRRKQNKPITLFSVLFDGFLQVKDPDQFTQTTYNGIGHGKSMGLGLLSFAKLVS